ncbi:acyl-CoA dehydrogenase family protein [Streptomyces sp. S186]|uniref:acyl-CoA dehydrogenase family protein n=1 Tax=Streptomyces sp. S186 TaxID=3434395 RepID=UPI003F67F9BE
MTPDQLADERALLGELVGDRPAAWDVAGELPLDLLRTLGAKGILCAEVPASHGGLGAGSRANGELTAYAGSLCSSLRSIMTSQGIAASTIQRFGDREQRKRYLAELTTGRLAAVGFSEPGAGSDLAAMRTRLLPSGDDFVLDGQKMWVTGARYADLLLVLARYGDDAAAVVVPADAPGVRIEPIADPMGCRAAGHSQVRLDQVRIPASAVLGGGGQSLALLFTTALSYGRISVAWGCVGILRACLSTAAGHARSREQSGRPLADHQLVAGHLADLLVAERVSAQTCAEASRSWESASPDMVVAAVLAKHVSAGHAARGASTAVQILASAGAQDGHVVARAYRDAKLMEIIEGSNEICRLILSQHAVDSF